MNKKSIVISLTVIIGFVVLAYFATNKSGPSQDFPDVSQIRQTDATSSASLGDHTQGKGKHVLVEYSDLQCPACKSFHEYLLQMKAKDKNFAKILDEKYTFVFRTFPLTNIHRNAELAAKAAESAGIQSKYFEFVDKVFATQQEWAESDTARAYFGSIAKDLKLDETKFDADIDSKLVTQKVRSDVASGTQANLEGTPTFYLDGKRITFGSFEEFKQILIDAAK